LGYKYIVRKMKESIYYSKHSAQIQVKPPLLKIRFYHLYSYCSEYAWQALEMSLVLYFAVSG